MRNSKFTKAFFGLLVMFSLPLEKDVKATEFRMLQAVFQR